MIALEYISAGALRRAASSLGFTVVAAVMAATAAFASATLSLPLWAMFIGWVAYLMTSPGKSGS
jgi:hypothetical protein